MRPALLSLEWIFQYSSSSWEHCSWCSLRAHFWLQEISGPSPPALCPSSAQQARMCPYAKNACTAAECLQSFSVFLALNMNSVFPAVYVINFWDVTQKEKCVVSWTNSSIQVKFITSVPNPFLFAWGEMKFQEVRMFHLNFFQSVLFQDDISF